MSIWNKAEKLLKPLQRFAKSERGNVALMVGLAAIPLVITGGSAIDYERAVNAKIQLYASLDSAALYAASLPDTTNSALTTKAQIYVQQNYKNNTDAVLSGFAVVNNGTTVTATANVQLHNYFMSMVGYPTTTVAAGSTVVKGGRNIEVSLVLDNTGSMGSVNAKTGNTAIFDLKAAATKFVNTVMPATQGTFYTKIAAIPYNNSVNTGSMAAALAARGSYLAGTSLISGFTKLTYTNMNNSTVTSGAITQCVTERLGVERYTDAAAALFPLGRQYSTNTNPCSVVPYVPLITDAATLNATIASMSAANYTAGQTGVAWGWYTLSPNIGLFSGASVPAGYDKLTTTNLAQKVKKIMILMTDGEYNSAYVDGVFSGQLPAYSNYINYNLNEVNKKAPDNNYAIPQATAMCAGIKATGIEVYVITFQLDPSHPERVAFINSCATDAAHVIDADNTSLDAAFSLIANKIQSLRISS